MTHSILVGGRPRSSLCNTSFPRRLLSALLHRGISCRQLLRAYDGDTALLAEHFAVRFAAESGWHHFPGFSPSARNELYSYQWPGNVRELVSVIERSIAMSPATILEPEDIWIDSLRHATPENTAIEQTRPTHDAKDETSDLGIFCERAAAKDFTLQDIEEAYIQQILTRTAGNKTTAAEILGLNRTTLHRRLNRTTTPPTPQRRLALVK